MPHKHDKNRGELPAFRSEANELDTGEPLLISQLYYPSRRVAHCAYAHTRAHHTRQLCTTVSTCLRGTRYSHLAASRVATRLISLA